MSIPEPLRPEPRPTRSARRPLASPKPGPSPKPEPSAQPERTVEPEYDGERTRAPERTPAPVPPAAARNRTRISGSDTDEFFAHQPTPTAALPSPGPLLENLTRCVMEVLAGARDIDQLARWVDDDVYRHVLTRVVLAARARAMKGQQAVRPNFTLGRTTIFSPCDGVVEAVVTVHSRARSRAVALRLEGLDGRWRATAINVL